MGRELSIASLADSICAEDSPSGEGVAQLARILRCDRRSRRISHYTDELPAATPGLALYLSAPAFIPPLLCRGLDVGTSEAQRCCLVIASEAP